MQAQMSEPVMMERYPAKSSSGTIATLFKLLILLSLIALAFYGYREGMFNQASNKASELIDQYFPSAATFTAQLLNKPATTNETAPKPDSDVAVAEATPAPAVATAPAAELPASPVMALETARRAFAAGDANAAIAAYREIITMNPGDMAAYGELGNVFYMLGMRFEAAQAYFEAASKALDRNQIDVAEALLPAILEGNTMLGTQLGDRLFDMRQRSQMPPQMMQPQFQQFPQRPYFEAE